MTKFASSQKPPKASCIACCETFETVALGLSFQGRLVAGRVMWRGRSPSSGTSTRLTHGREVGFPGTISPTLSLSFGRLRLKHHDTSGKIGWQEFDQLAWFSSTTLGRSPTGFAPVSPRKGCARPWKLLSGSGSFSQPTLSQTDGQHALISALRTGSTKRLT